MLVLAILPWSFVSAQGDIDEQAKSLIRHEQSGYIMFNTNGWGLGANYGKMKSIYKKTLYSFEFSEINHPKELKLNNPIYPEGRRYVFGKLNEFYAFRLGYGALKTLYFKKDKGGIEVRYLYHTGLSLGVLKPVYFEIINSQQQLQTERFNSSMHNYLDIYGRASYFKGMDELSVVPGVYFKTGASFEFGKKDLIINALEGGAAVEFFAKPIDIMATASNRWYFLSLFVAIRYGQIKDPRLKYLKAEE